MARSIVDLGKSPFMPPALSAFLRRRLLEIIGLCLLISGTALLIALASYSSMDPSANHAAAGPVHNWLGPRGAWTADWLLQMIGLAAIVPAAVVTIWGWHLLAKRAVGYAWLRLALLPPALLLAAAALAALPSPDGWPLRASLGGIVGSSLLNNIITLISLADLHPDAWVLAAAAGALSLAALIGTLGFSFVEWRDAFRRMFWLADRGGRAGIEAGRTGMRVGNDFASRIKRRFSKRRRVEPRFASGQDELEPADIVREEIAAARTTPLVKSHAREDDELVEAKQKRAKPSKRAAGARQTSFDLKTGEYQLPPLDILELPPESRVDPSINKDALEQNARVLKSVLEDFGVKGEILKVRPGPVVTLYELEPAPGVKASRVIGLADDIARSMSAVSARIAVVPGRNVIGIELPNARRETVYLRELLSTEEYERTPTRLALVLGKDISGAPVIADIARMPHLLIAGTTGSGKSVAINTMILSLLYRLSPDECKFIMIDPKMLELSVYDGIPHLLAPVVTEPAKAIVALRWTVKEMENRYRAMSQLGVRNIIGYNQRLTEASRKREKLLRTVQTGFDPETGKPIFEEQPLDLSPLPYIVVIVDEMADLMMVAGKDVEAAVQRLAQMARAAGIHIIMATQRPSVDVITGTIKANFPTRISFQVTSKIDSRTILGESGAEQLLGQGDMLYMAGGGRISRVHGPFVSDREVESVVKALKSQGEPDYLDSVTEDDEAGMTAGFGGAGDSSGDALYDQAVALVCRERKASTSFVQRYLQIGYNRAARIIERMEAEGVISTANHVGKREVLGRNIDER